MMTMEKLKPLVRREAEKLKGFATKEELSRLSLESLDSDDVRYCIYGQITGHCASARAVELLNLCAKPYSLGLLKYEPTRKRVFKRKDCYFVPLDPTYSAIEFFICHADKEALAALIAYLKGETEILDI
jgi:hypothetical protein